MVERSTAQLGRAAQHCLRVSEVIRLKSEIRQQPHLMHAIQQSRNKDLVMLETEAQFLKRASTVLKFDFAGKVTKQDTEATVNKLMRDMPHLHHKVEPMVSFAVKYGRENTPFFPDLLSFHSEHVVATKAAADAEFWSCVAGFPSERPWSACAITKDNWSGKVKGGVCMGVAPGKANGLVSHEGGKSVAALEPRACAA